MFLKSKYRAPGWSLDLLFFFFPFLTGSSSNTTGGSLGSAPSTFKAITSYFLFSTSSTLSTFGLPYVSLYSYIFSSTFYSFFLSSFSKSRSFIRSSNELSLRMAELKSKSSLSSAVVVFLIGFLLSTTFSSAAT